MILILGRREADENDSRFQLLGDRARTGEDGSVIAEVFTLAAITAAAEEWWRATHPRTRMDVAGRQRVHELEFQLGMRRDPPDQPGSVIPYKPLVQMTQDERIEWAAAALKAAQAPSIGIQFEHGAAGT